MKRLVLALALLGLSVPLASACEYKRSVEAKPDMTTVASISSEQQNLSASADAQPVKPVQSQSPGD
ncbi:MAG: hypothetical protein KF874_03000 [Rhizobiaceae bacterium]|nr:hypothetical protein [Rhizobiaceae bacterium]